MVLNIENILLPPTSEILPNLFALNYELFLYIALFSKSKTLSKNRLYIVKMQYLKQLVKVSKILNYSDKYNKQKFIYQLLNPSFHKYLNSLCYLEKVDKLSQFMIAV
ncbi:hypothetical protein Tery_4568 [Trichodesmium erythraeum IMS101]|uniref:Uncharacterized protein n=1 Tax=Trichodesmium erythraeum (strain IMS101) TaxID=203124 RepID=Q10W30_TRIEI